MSGLAPSQDRPRGRALGLAVAVVVSAVSCSLVYDGNVFVLPDAAPPPPPPVDAAPPPDVNVGALLINEIEPADVLEGAGAGRGVPIVLTAATSPPTPRW